MVKKEWPVINVPQKELEQAEYRRTSGLFDVCGVVTGKMKVSVTLSFPDCREKGPLLFHAARMQHLGTCVGGAHSKLHASCLSDDHLSAVVGRQIDSNNKQSATKHRTGTGPCKRFGFEVLIVILEARAQIDRGW